MNGAIYERRTSTSDGRRVGGILQRIAERVNIEFNAVEGRRPAVRESWQASPIQHGGS